MRKTRRRNRSQTCSRYWNRQVGHRGTHRHTHWQTCLARKRTRLTLANNSKTLFLEGLLRHRHASNEYLLPWENAQLSFFSLSHSLSQFHQIFTHLRFNSSLQIATTTSSSVALSYHRTNKQTSHNTIEYYHFPSVTFVSSVACSK